MHCYRIKRIFIYILREIYIPTLPFFLGEVKSFTWGRVREDESKPGLSDLLISHCVAMYWNTPSVKQKGPSGGIITVHRSSLPAVPGARVRDWGAAARRL